MDVYQPMPYLIKTFLPCPDHPYHSAHIFYLDTPVTYIEDRYRLHNIHSINYNNNYIAVFVESAFK